MGDTNYTVLIRPSPDGSSVVGGLVFICLYVILSIKKERIRRTVACVKVHGGVRWRQIVKNKKNTHNPTTSPFFLSLFSDTHKPAGSYELLLVSSDKKVIGVP